jgi:hypothetical protein
LNIVVSFTLKEKFESATYVDAAKMFDFGALPTETTFAFALLDGLPP